MKFTLSIDCDNAAFSDDTDGDPRPEIGRILRSAALQVECLNPPLNPSQLIVLHDINGNRVGQAQVK